MGEALPPVLLLVLLGSPLDGDSLLSMGGGLPSVLLLVLLGSPLSAEPGGTEFEKPAALVLLLVSPPSFFDC